MLLLVLTSYLFVQGPRLWAWRNCFLSPKAIPRFRPFSVVRTTQVFIDSLFITMDTPEMKETIQTVITATLILRVVTRRG